MSFEQIAREHYQSIQEDVWREAADLLKVWLYNQEDTLLRLQLPTLTQRLEFPFKEQSRVPVVAFPGTRWYFLPRKTVLTGTVIYIYMGVMHTVRGPEEEDIDYMLDQGWQRVYTLADVGRLLLEGWKPWRPTLNALEYTP